MPHKATSIFITGATGFFGKSFLDYQLRHNGFLADSEITILSRDPDAFMSAYPVLAAQHGLRWIKGDVRNFIFPCDRFDTVIHAATSAVTTLSDEVMSSTIIDGTRHVLEFAKTCGARRLLFTSSGAVYGPQIAPVDETTPCHPTTAYGQSKLLAEQMCIDSGIPTLIARCFAFVGPYLNRHIHYAIGNFMQDCVDNKTITIQGDGTPLRSYLYADDLVEWLFAILENGKPGQPYNVGSPKGLSILELAETVRSSLGTGNDIKVLGTPTGALPSVYVPITDRVQSDLGLQVTVNLTTAIKKSIS